MNILYYKAKLLGRPFRYGGGDGDSDDGGDTGDADASSDTADATGISGMGFSDAAAAVGNSSSVGVGAVGGDVGGLGGVSIGSDGQSSPTAAASTGGVTLGQMASLVSAVVSQNPVAVAVAIANMTGNVSIGQGISAVNAIANGNVSGAISALGGLAGSLGSGGMGSGGAGTGSVGGGTADAGFGGDNLLDMLGQPTTSGASGTNYGPGTDINQLMSLLGGGQQTAPLPVPVPVASGQENAADVQLMENIFGPSLSAPPAGDPNEQARELARLLRS